MTYNSSCRWCFVFLMIFSAIILIIYLTFELSGLLHAKYEKSNKESDLQNIKIQLVANKKMYDWIKDNYVKDNSSCNFIRVHAEEKSTNRYKIPFDIFLLHAASLACIFMLISLLLDFLSNANVRHTKTVHIKKVAGNSLRNKCPFCQNRIKYPMVTSMPIIQNIRTCEVTNETLNNDTVNKIYDN